MQDVTKNIFHISPTYRIELHIYIKKKILMMEMKMKISVIVGIYYCN